MLQTFQRFSFSDTMMDPRATIVVLLLRAIHRSREFLDKMHGSNKPNPHEREREKAQSSSHFEMIMTVQMTCPHGGCHTICIAHVHIGLVFDQRRQTIGVLRRARPSAMATADEHLAWKHPLYFGVEVVLFLYCMSADHRCNTIDANMLIHRSLGY